MMGSASALPNSSRGVLMLARQLVSQVLDDDALTRGLRDPEARVLVEWLVERAEDVAAEASCSMAAASQVAKLRRRGRSISHFVALWCHLDEPGAAGQLATAERLNWPLPDGPVDPCELMQNILNWEEQQLHTFGVGHLSKESHIFVPPAA
jgi:hypothetical protein